MRILIIEDDKELNYFLKKALISQLFVVDSAEDGEKGSFLARTNPYDLIVLDFNLPKLNGNEVLKEIRQEKKTPILILSINASLDDKKEMFEAGADDYLVKPFVFKEFILRVNALLRRPKNIEEKVLKFADITLNLKTKEVRRDNKKIHLTNKEYNLLEFFLRRQKDILSRSEIMEHVWDINADPFSNSIEAHILNLRKKINLKKKKNYLQTINGRGYKLDYNKF
jgi:two-component system, OmpR family, copper resistance phosphate regulon response regulator CusR